MELLAEQPLQNQYEQFDKSIRFRNDTVTWLAETLNGSMRTSFDYYYDGQELYAADNGAMGEVFDFAITQAKTIVEDNPSLLFELRRRIAEKGEYQDMLAMAAGDLPNTMIVVSDFPPELMAIKTDVGGYNADRKQTMLRVISRQPDGTLKMVSQSLDGSNRQALEAIYHKLGVQPAAGELLPQRVYRDLPADWQSTLVDNLRDAHDESLSQQLGGNWHAGIKQTDEHRVENTNDFVLQQIDLVDWFVQAKLANPVAAEKLRYKLAATISERFKRQMVVRHLSPNLPPIYHFQSQPQLTIEIERSTERAIKRGESFSGCGMTVKNELDSLIDNQLDEAGYGNQSDKQEEDEYGPLNFKCPKGHHNRRPRGGFIDECQKCRISVRC